MTISSSGFYGLTLRKMLNNGAALDLEADTHKAALVTNSHTPDFDAHDFYNDLTNEIASGGGYTTGGNTLTGTTLTVVSGLLSWDATDLSWTSATISAARAAVIYADALSDELICLVNFGADASVTSGTLTVQWNSAGIFTLDFVP